MNVMGILGSQEPGAQGPELPTSLPPSPAAPTKRSEPWMLLSLVLFAAASFIYVLLGGQAMEIRPRKTVTAAPARPAPSSDVTERDRLLDNLQSQGVIVKRTCITNEAQVNPLGWRALNADAQRTVARALAAWCEDQGRGRQMTIIDEQSGHPLAEVYYGEYRVY